MNVRKPLVIRTSLKIRPISLGLPLFKEISLVAELLKPNSTNTIKELLQRLFELGLVDTKISKTPFNIKYYRLNDDAYLKLATEEADNWKKRTDEEYEKAKEGPDNDDQEFEPLTPLDFDEN